MLRAVVEEEKEAVQSVEAQRVEEVGDAGLVVFLVESGREL